MQITLWGACALVVFFVGDAILNFMERRKHAWQFLFARFPGNSANELYWPLQYQEQYMRRRFKIAIRFVMKDGGLSFINLQFSKHEVYELALHWQTIRDRAWHLSRDERKLISEHIQTLTAFARIVEHVYPLSHERRA